MDKTKAAALALLQKKGLMPVAKNRKVLRVGVPIKLTKLVALLDALDDVEDAIVTHYNGELVVEAPQPTLDVDVP